MYPSTQVQRLNIFGDRQAGKTTLLIDIAIDEAARQHRDVLYMTPSYDQDEHTHRLIRERATQIVPDLISVVRNANGKQSITFKGGGRIRYRQQRGDYSVDTHIIDDVAPGDSCVGATRIFRAHGI